VLDLTGDPANDLATVRREVAAFDAEMIERPALIALNKLDLVDIATAEERAHALHAATGLEVFVISAEARVGLAPLATAIADRLREKEAVAVQCLS
jgi:GTPase